MFLCLATLALAASPALLGADGESETFKSLAGKWRRPTENPLPQQPLAPGKGRLNNNTFGDLQAITKGVIPELWFVGKDETTLRELGMAAPGRWNLVVGGFPMNGSLASPDFGSSHAVRIPADDSKHVLALTVAEGKSPWELKTREVTVHYKIDKDTLTIECNESLPAGHHLGAYDVSGSWVRTRASVK
jgi:hypothetical protein